MKMARLAHIHPLNVPVPYKYKALWTVKHYYSNRPAHIYSMYFIVTLFAVIYIPEVSTVFSGTQYRLNYGVYCQTIHPTVQLGNNYIIGSISITLPSPRAPIESYHINDPCKTFFERSGGSTVSHHHIHDCSRIVRLTKELNNLCLNIVSKVKYTLASIQRIMPPHPTTHLPTYIKTKEFEGVLQGCFPSLAKCPMYYLGLPPRRMSAINR